MPQKINILLERADGIRQHYRVNRSHLKDLEKVGKIGRRVIWRKKREGPEPPPEPPPEPNFYLVKVYASVHTGTAHRGNQLEVDAHYFATATYGTDLPRFIADMRDYLDSEITAWFGNVPRTLQPDEGAEIEETATDRKPEAILNWRNNGGPWKRKDITP